MQLEYFQDMFKTVGVNVAALTVDRPSVLKRFSDRHDISYPLLNDRGAIHANAFQVRNKSYRRGDRAYGVPHPGVLFIDASGVVRGKAAERGFETRPSFETIWHVVRDSGAVRPAEDPPGRELDIE